MSQFFESGDQSIGVSASASVLPMNIQDWFPLGWTGWISLLSKLHSKGNYKTKNQEGNLQNGTKYLQKGVTGKGLISKIYEQLVQLKWKET